MTDDLLIVFIKNPEAGKVKTRLAKTIGNASALKVYRALLKHTNDITKQLSCNKILYYSEAINQTDIWSNQTYQKDVQIGSNLGERMQHAIKSGFQSGYKKIVLIGSDCYELQSGHIQEAFDALNDHNITIGPARDGGYYLIGLTREYPQIFSNKPWGTSTVLEETLKDLNDEAVFLLKSLNDVDTFNDLKSHNNLLKLIKKHD
ncbi:MAG: TIGR04282 family arsenosugar biosynthesis glycosyltransferase [Bacteroidia bacterium]|nr:TIGR04282 family arsenosugar biosynthesis glycosyltransferase [Bacteroidia bacterium]